MRVHNVLQSFIALATITVSLVGCGDGPTEAGTGSLEVSTLTIGSAIDSDGYRVELGGDFPYSIGANAVVTVPDLRPAQYSAELTGLENNCSVVGENPVVATVAGEETATVRFEIACPPFLDHIAFRSDRDGDSEIFIMNSDGSDPINITRNPARDGRPEWAPDGMRIAFESDRLGITEIFVMDADGSNVARLTNSSGARNPAWSPLGSEITFDVDAGGASEIYKVRTDGSGAAINLTNHVASDRESDWSPDGARIAFISDREPAGLGLGSALFVMNADGSNPINLINDSCIAFPDWAPDGTRIAYQASCTGGAHEIIVVDVDGTNRVNLTNHPAEDYVPAWSSDGTKIVFDRYADGNGEIFVMDADGSNQVNLTDHPDYDGSPAWSLGP